MIRNIQFGLIISVSTYILITFISFLITKSIQLETIRLWGFGLSLLLFIASFPLYKSAYHAGKVANPTYTTYIPPDEHLHHKIQHDYEATKKRIEGSYQGIFIWASLITLLITILLAILF